MCGRITLTCTYPVLQACFGINHAFVLKPRFNIAPSQLVPVIKTAGQLSLLPWGLVPSWQRDRQKTGFIHARLETVLEKPSFKRAYQKNRCVIVCDGYYEWRTIARAKQPYYLFLKTRQPFMLAGIFDRHEAEPGNWVETCAILTTQATQRLSHIHHRMPVILENTDLESWLITGLPKNKLENIQEKQEIDYFPVSTRVNCPEYDSPACIQRL